MYNIYSKKLFNLFNKIFSLFYNPYFGFINGHFYLSNVELKHLLRLIKKTQNDEQLTLEFEENFSKLIGHGKSLSFAAGRMAFYTYMKSLEIGYGDEVIIQSSNCSVMVNAVLRTGAKPIFSDINENTLGSDPKSIKSLITIKTKLIVAQHSFGIPCEIDEISNLAKQFNIKLLEDCALTVGSTFKGLTVGNWGDAALFSIDHSKPLNCMIGGMLYLNDDNIYQKIKIIRDGMPNLDEKHQLAIYNRLLFERKYYSPRKYSQGRFLEMFYAFLAKIKKVQPAFLLDDYNRPTLPNKSYYSYPAKLPVFISQLGLYELKYFKEKKLIRKQLLEDYIKIFVTNNKSKLLPQAYFDKQNDIVPLRFIAYFPDRSSAYQYFSKILDVNSSWFQNTIIGTNDIEGMGYILGSCENSERISKKVINFPCTFDINQIIEIKKKINLFLSR